MAFAEMEPLDIAVENINDLKLKLTITVPGTEVKEAYDVCYRGLNSRVNINGFRRGKIPRSVLEKRFEKQMRQEALESIVPQNFEKALETKGLQPLGKPEFDNFEIQKNKPLKFTATFEVWPDFAFPESSSFELEEIEIKVTDEELEELKDKFLDEAAQFVEKDGAADEGDQVLMDFTLIVDEDDISEEEDYEYLLGSNQFLPEIEEVLKGVKAGEVKELTITIPESHAELSLRGKEVKFLFHLKEVRGKQLPELNTEFFKGYGEEINSEEDFIELLKQEIIRKKESENIAAYRSKIKEQLIKRLTFPVPDEIRKKEVEYQLSVLQQENDKKAATDKLSTAELEKQAEKAAGNHLRFLAYIEKMVKEFNLQVDEEEVKHKFAVNARMLGIDLNDQTQQKRSNDFYNAFYQTVQENAVLDYLTNQILKK